MTLEEAIEKVEGRAPGTPCVLEAEELGPWLRELQSRRRPLGWKGMLLFIVFSAGLVGAFIGFLALITAPYDECSKNCRNLGAETGRLSEPGGCDCLILVPKEDL